MRALGASVGEIAEAVAAFEALTQRERDSRRRFLDELGPAAVIATGGLADVVAPYSSCIEHREPWLTLHGLRLIYERNQQPR